MGHLHLIKAIPHDGNLCIHILSIRVLYSQGLATPESNHPELSLVCLFSGSKLK